MLQSTKIGTRIVIGFVIQVALQLCVVLAAAIGAAHLADEQASLTGEVDSAFVSKQILIDELQLRRFEKDIMLNLAKPAKVAEYREKWQKAAEQFAQTLDKTRQLADASEQPAVAELQRLYATYRSGFEQVAKAADAGQYADPGAMNQAMTPFKQSIHDLEQQASTYAAAQRHHRTAATTRVEQSMVWLRQAGTITVALTLLAAAVIATLISRSIKLPLQLLEFRVQKAAAERDLTCHIDYHGKDEVGSVISAINQFFASVRQLIGSAKDGCSQLNQTAGSLMTVASEQNRAISHQADATSSTAASIEQLTVSISHVAETASAVEQDARRSQQLATDGRSLAVQTAGEINRIADSIRQSSEVIASLERRSAEIGGIVHVIKDIADQTNLLALNAAIEAARAGEQGRGFAVVADEVRKLAEKTTQATNEISTMIQAVQQDTNIAVGTMGEASNTVTRGVDLTQQVAESLDTINQMAIQSANKIAGIASAIGEQGTASTQIAQNIEKIAQMGEQNSAATAQLADLAQNLNQLSDTLGVTIKSYRS